MSRSILASILGLCALIFVGCSGDTEDPAANVASPAEGARVINQNPSSPTVDVPGTPSDESSTAAPATTEPAPATTEPAPESAEPAPEVVPAPAEPTPAPEEPKAEEPKAEEPKGEN